MTTAPAREQLHRPHGALALVASALLGSLLWLVVRAEGPEPTRDDAPLRLPEVSAVCGAGRDSARDQGSESERAANAKIARYPFAAADGLAALRGLAEAEDCYTLAGDAAARIRAHARAERLRARLERDYRDHLTRYREARAAGRTSVALSELRFLLAVLSREPAPWIAKLRRAQSELEAAAQREATP